MLCYAMLCYAMLCFCKGLRPFRLWLGGDENSATVRTRQTWEEVLQRVLLAGVADPSPPTRLMVFDSLDCSFDAWLARPEHSIAYSI